MLLTTRTKSAQMKVHVPPEYSAARLRIVCATDLSSKSDFAVQRAVSLCEALDAQLMLLHVVGEELPMRLAGRRAERARTALQWQAKHLSGLRFAPELSVRIGRPSRTIARAAREWSADMVVLGSHRRRVDADLLSWSTAEHIAHRAQRPVLVVNTEAAREYCGVTFVAGKAIERFVHLADRFDFLDAAHLAVVPRLGALDAALQKAATVLSKAGERIDPALKLRWHRRSQTLIEEAGLHLLGVEIVSERPTARSLLARINQARHPQLLVAGIDRRDLFTRSLSRMTALLALRTRACDVLIASKSCARQMRAVSHFQLSDGMYEGAQGWPGTAR